jgi:hypothetical protein
MVTFCPEKAGQAELSLLFPREVQTGLTWPRVWAGRHTVNENGKLQKIMEKRLKITHCFPLTVIIAARVIFLPVLFFVPLS